MVPQDLEEQRTERPIRVEPVERFPSLDKGLLERITGIVRTPEHTHCKTKTGPLIGSYEGLVESDPACFACPDQFFFDLRLQRVSSLPEP
jgi:hypothetical protein